MTATRRGFLRLGGGLVAALSVPRIAAGADGAVEVAMAGRADGSRVWFDPIGLRVEPGRTLRWVNRNPGNSHTSTAYHPAISGRPRRIPEGAAPWDSDYLLPGESFEVVLTQPGVYDYYCVPHEHAGMVGRIVVGAPQPDGWLTHEQESGAEDALPEAALRAFPSVDEIMRKGRVRRS